MILASLGMALYQSLAYYAAHTVSASFIGIIASVIPLLTLVLNVPLLSHRLILGIVMGSLLSFAGIPASVFAPNLWILAVKHLGAGTASVFMNLAPVFTLAIAVCVHSAGGDKREVE
ncbi:EamA family transporter [Bowmanella pacifica]|uniref:EamA domain-containing protein n=1 Tax=Bowmanella pacifica TaxID=502051 RepID=A0A917Z367_9ALTE|nr:EamA family transporter [Bowmanella pacifica]GGO72694.1 hypothetical protein GCM10010982_31430 [Bowmanella pacifica]